MSDSESSDDEWFDAVEEMDASSPTSPHDQARRTLGIAGLVPQRRQRANDAEEVERPMAPLPSGEVAVRDAEGEPAGRGREAVAAEEAGEEEGEAAAAANATEAPATAHGGGVVATAAPVDVNVAHSEPLAVPQSGGGSGGGGGRPRLPSVTEVVGAHRLGASVSPPVVSPPDNTPSDGLLARVSAGDDSVFAQQPELSDRLRTLEQKLAARDAREAAAAAAEGGGQSSSADTTPAGTATPPTPPANTPASTTPTAPTPTTSSTTTTPTTSTTPDTTATDTTEANTTDTTTTTTPDTSSAVASAPPTEDVLELREEELLQPSEADCHTSPRSVDGHTSEDAPPVGEGPPLMDFYFVKNLDTGEQFHLDDIDKRVEAAADPSLLGADLANAQAAGGGTATTASARREAEKEEERRRIREDQGKRGKKKEKKNRTWHFLQRRKKKDKKSRARTLEKPLRREKGATSGTSRSDPCTPATASPRRAVGERVRTAAHKKNRREFAHVQRVQQLSVHTGAVWCMEFSHDGEYLATAGQDSILYVWEAVKDDASFAAAGEEAAEGGGGNNEVRVFARKPHRKYVGHESDILDVAWSKTNFLLSSSFDKTVRLWHLAREEQLCVFRHTDFVTSITFHPVDDKFFLSGSMDSKLRIWNVPDKRVVSYVDTKDLVTASCFSPDGKHALAGSYNGKCKLYQTDGLRFVTQVDVRSSRGKNAKGKMITGMVFHPREPNQLLITTNDSRVRMYNLDNYTLTCKYKGNQNLRSKIKATFSDDGRYVISGSENQQAYVWQTHNSYVPSAFTSFRKDRNESWESFAAHNSIVTVAVFGPQSMCKWWGGPVLLTGGYSGEIKVFGCEDSDSSEE